MTVQTRAQLLADLALYLADNASGDISPADLRQRFVDLVDSLKLSAEALVIPGSANPTPTTEGQIDWDTDNDDLVLGTGAGPARFSRNQSGTWTPELRFGGANTGITYAARAGFWSRRKDICVVQGQVQLSNKGSATGNAVVYGLPAALKTGARGGLALGYCSGLTSLGNSFCTVLSPGNTTVELYYLGAGSITGVTNSNFTNSTEIQFSGAYLTD